MPDGHSLHRLRLFVRLAPACFWACGGRFLGTSSARPCAVQPSGKLGTRVSLRLQVAAPGRSSERTTGSRPGNQKARREGKFSHDNVWLLWIIPGDVSPLGVRAEHFARMSSRSVALTKRENERQQMKLLKSLTGTTVLVVFFNVAVVASETLIVPATNVNGVWSSPLTQGQLYEFTASGTYYYGWYGEQTADAEWIFGNAPQISEYWTWPVAGGPFGESNDILDICINDTSVSWLGTTDGLNYSPHTYSQDTHTYKYYFTGTGDPVKFHIADETPFGVGDCTGDNSGCLTVAINEIPEPSTAVFVLFGLAAMSLRKARSHR